MTTPPRTDRVSRFWLAGFAVAALAALAAMLAAVVIQTDASRPVGEGEVFVADAGVVADLVTAAADPDEAVRRARNRLGVLAVSMVDADLTHVVSSSPNLVGQELSVPFLRRDPMPLRALTAPTGLPILIDGIEEAAADEAVYQVLAPVGDGSSVLIHYDLRDLTARRAVAEGITPAALLAGSLALLFLALAAALVIGRAGARRRIVAGLEEAQRLEARAAELAEHNRLLEDARAAAEQALALAEEKNRIRSEFVLMINHELNTPLTGVVTSAELMAAHPEMPEEDRQHLLDAMIQQGELLRRLVSRMLTLARLENRGLGYSLRPVSAEALCDELRTNGAIEVTDPPDSWAVMADREGMISVITALTENAHNHGGRDVGVAFVDGLPFPPDLAIGDPDLTGRYVVVSDDGPGIDAEFLPRIFEKFEKRSDSPGTGLGLYLARLMVDAMGGSIAVSTGPEGTRVAVGAPPAVGALL